MLLTPKDRRRSRRGRHLLPDGRTLHMRRYKQLVRELTAEIGAPLTATEELLVGQAAALVVKAEAIQTMIVAGQAVDTDEAVRDPDIFGRWFKDASTWSNWFVFLKATFGIPLDDDELAAFRKFTERTAPAVDGYREATLVVGRGGGKSLILALIAAFLSTFHDWSPYLTHGERGVIMIVASDRKSARPIFRYLKEMLKSQMDFQPTARRGRFSLGPVPKFTFERGFRFPASGNSHHCSSGKRNAQEVNAR
jgi:hypothetical protein